MTKIPLTVCLFTSTKGHWGNQNRYRETVTHLGKIFPLADLHLFAHIKISPGDNEQALLMETWLKSYGFKVVSTIGKWDHQDLSHQTEYIRDMNTVYFQNDVNAYPYVLHLEDDWLLQPAINDFSYWLHLAMKLLETEHNLMQIRIPRFNNEVYRICKLKDKHGIDAYASYGNSREYFYHNDWSNNPFIARTRDMRTALLLMKKDSSNQNSAHSEHGLGMYIKFLSFFKFSLICLNPAMMRAYHIGTRAGEEDVIGQILESN